MKGLKKRCLSIFLCIVMILTMIPAETISAEETGTFTKVTKQEDLTSGKYIMVVDKVYAAGYLDNNWITSAEVTAQGDALVNPDSNLIWTLTVSADGKDVHLVDSKEKEVSPGVGNKNAIKQGEYTWTLVFSDGTVSFQGKGEDTVTLASNKSSSHKFRAYKNDTVSDSPAGYPSEFTLYKLKTTGSGGEENVQVQNPTANVESGTVATGTAIVLSCETADSTIKVVTGAGINLEKPSEDAVWLDYSEPIIVNQSMTIFAKAVKEGQEDSNTVQFEYTIKDPVESDVVIPDGNYVIYNVANKMALSATEIAAQYYNAGVSKEFTGSETSVSVDASLVWTVTNNEDGTATISYGTDKLSMDTSFSSTPMNKANDKWSLIAQEDGTVLVKNEGRSMYLEWYASKVYFSGYGDTSNIALFKMAFIPATVSGDGPVNPGTEIIADGNYVIYVPAFKKALSSVYSGYYNESADLTVDDAATTVEVDETLIWKITNTSDGKITIECNDGKLSMDTSYNSMPLNKANDSWILEKAEKEGCYYIKNAGRGNYIEWYEDQSSFSTFSLNKTKSNLYEMKLIPAKTAPDTELPVITLPGTAEIPIGADYTFSVDVEDNKGVASVQVEYKLPGADVVIEEAMTQNSSNPSKWEYTIPGLELSKEGQLQISVTAKDTSGNTGYSSTTNPNFSLSVVDKPMLTEVSPANGVATGDVKRPQISWKGTNLGDAPTATVEIVRDNETVLEASPMTYFKETNTFSYTPAADLIDGTYRIKVVVKRADNAERVTEWSFVIGEPKYKLYYGQLHSHTAEYSDGSGTLAAGLEYIKNIDKSDNVQFVAFTDHSNYFDKTTANPEAALYDKTKMTEESLEKWNKYKQTVADFNDANKDILAIAGFEMTWSGGPGHINTFNSAGIVSRNNTVLNNKSADAGMKAYYALLSQSECAGTNSQFNHPGTTFGTFSDFAYWDPVIDSRINLIEVGNGEGLIGNNGYYPSYEYYTMALDKGWHVAPTNNQDNHKGKWGNANDARDVIITDNFSEQGIYDAMSNHRMYSTEDKNLEITYTVNDLIMGSKIAEVPDKLNVQATLNDPDDVIKKAELIVNSGRVVYTWDINDTSKEIRAEIDPDYSYYYLRVTEQDGDLAVTSPVWIGDAVMIGISSVESSTRNPVTDEELTLTTTLFNTESVDATVKSLVYKMDDTELYTDTTVGTLEKATTKSYTFKFTPTKARVQTIKVEAVIEKDGKEFSYSKNIELNVKDASKQVYIGIDGSHYNEYVTGNYKDSMTNFSDLAAESNVRCVVLKTSSDLIDAANNVNGKYAMLILTAPSRRLQLTTGGERVCACYTDDEIAAIKGFSEKGGTLILCNWSDYYENYSNATMKSQDEHMASQQNKLLAAIGSKLRMSDDGSVDDVETAERDSNRRLYPSTYNFTNQYLEGIIFDEANPDNRLYSEVYSQYAGSTIYATDASGVPVSELPESVSPIVYGHSTTYSVDNDKDEFGGVGEIPKYTVAENDKRALLLANEILNHSDGTKSNVIVAGAAFMSNFEIQASLDSNAEKNYSNYRILENIIASLAPDFVDTIASVQAEKDEGVNFTVEGIVTSNASGYDKDTAFFDCIYVQDETAGINAFPVAENYKVGQKVRISGTTSSYNGERQLYVKSIKLLDENVVEVIPKSVKASDINKETYLGSLVKLEGDVMDIKVVNDAVESILVTDESGETARVFIDGYITSSKEIEGLVVGARITAIGLSSYDESYDGIPARIRVRDRADITCVAGGVTPKVDESKEKEEQENITLDDAQRVKLDISQKAIQVFESFGVYYGEDGKKVTNSFVVDKDGKRFVLNDKGEKIKNAIIISKSGKLYIADINGTLVCGKIVEVNGMKYYTTKRTGMIVVNKVFKWKGKKYIASVHGSLLISKKKTIQGKQYTTDKDGVVIQQKKRSSR